MFANNNLLSKVPSRTNYFQVLDCTSFINGKLEIIVFCLAYSGGNLRIKLKTFQAPGAYKRDRVGEAMCGPAFFPGALEARESFHEQG